MVDALLFPFDIRFSCSFSMTLKIRRVWGLLHSKSYVVAKRPPAGVALYNQTTCDPAYPTGFKALKSRWGRELTTSSRRTPAPLAFIKRFSSYIHTTPRKMGGNEIHINIDLSEPGSRENLVATKPGVIFRSQKQNEIVLSFTAMPERGTLAARSFVKNERAAIDGHLRLEPVAD
ncbi:hypothetical protein AVEN_40937-1 [Araneus ventricosus]|uniref:Uncharacterized protein n=1 Tax=Araneus ventricosus TaxID=182803 RepID=A0A4Y2PWI9_ARAVE|nr:hypothetical protein AVEN_40937-1 [Araneus ventricosus]